MMRVNPEYFQMSDSEQECYRADIPEEDETAIQKHLMVALFGCEQSEDDLRDTSKANILNEAILPIRGIGEDSIWLNEYLGEKTLIDFETYYDFDIDDHRFQVEANQRDFPDYEEEEYRGCLFRRWARLFVDGEFTYADICSAAGYVCDELFDTSSDILQAHIPHEYVRGRDDGKREGSGFLLDLKKDANGKEAELEELSDRQNRYLMTRRAALADEWFQGNRCEVYILDTSSDGERNQSFIFSDPKAMKAVRFRHFLRDCRTIQADSRPLMDCVATEKKKLADYTAEQFADIEANFDPKIVKLKKKRKIVLTSQAMDDLLQID